MSFKSLEEVKTVFFDAIYADSVLKAKTFLNKYPDLINSEDPNGFNALEITAILGYSKMAGILLKKTSNCRSSTHTLMIARKYAKEQGHNNLWQIFQNKFYDHLSN